MDVIVFLKEEEEYIEWRDSLKQEGEELSIEKRDSREAFLKPCRDGDALRTDNMEWAAIFSQKPCRGGAALWVTDDAEAARSAAENGFPVIYYERSGQDRVWQADMTVLSLEGLEGTLMDRVFRRHYGLPWIICRTWRLLIRESIREDFEALYRMDREDSGNPFLLHMSEDKEAERETFNAYLKHQYPLYGYGLYTLEERESHTVIGRAGFAQRQEQGKTCLELGYQIGKRFRRMGYAGEAVYALGERMEELTGEQTAWIFCHPGNLPSIRTAKRLLQSFPDRFSLVLTRSVC